MKICKACGLSLPLERFYRHKATTDGLRPKCKACCHAANVAWRAANVERHRARDRLNHSKGKIHGLTRQEIRAIYDNQHGLCAVCKGTISLGAPGVRATAQIDHDHDHCPGKRGCAECVRGLLCRTCNILIGYIELPQYDAALAYLTSDQKEMAA